MGKFVEAYIFVPFHHFTCGGEDDWCWVKVADVPAMGSHLRKILSVMKMVMVLVTKMMMLVDVIALTRGSVNNHVVQFSMLRMHRTLKKETLVISKHTATTMILNFCFVSRGSLTFV